MSRQKNPTYEEVEEAKRYVREVLVPLMQQHPVQPPASNTGNVIDFCYYERCSVCGGVVDTRNRHNTSAYGSWMHPGCALNYFDFMGGDDFSDFDF